MENEQADAGRDGRTHLAGPNSQARTGTTGKYLFFPVQLTTSRIGNLTRLIHNYYAMLFVMTIHYTYILYIVYIHCNNKESGCGVKKRDAQKLVYGDPEKATPLTRLRITRPVCADGLSAVNFIGRQLRDLIN